MSTKKKNSHGKPYPYKIPPVPYPSEEAVKQLDPWDDILEFFRIEALLRSKKVHLLFKRKRRGQPGHDINLFQKFGFTWKVLKGEHHYRLKPIKQRPLSWRPRERVHDLISRHMQSNPEAKEWIKSGILDLSAIAKSDFKVSKERGKEEYAGRFTGALVTQLAESAYWWGGRYVFFGLDISAPPTRVLGTLKPILQKLHKSRPATLFKYPLGATYIEGKRYQRNYPRPYHLYKDPPIAGYVGIKTWINYFRCYDFQKEEGMTFGQIGKEVYGELRGKPQARDLAEKAVKRVTRLIKDAESGNWPPPKIK